MSSSHVAADNSHNLPECSCSRCLYLHTCLHQGRSVLRSGPEELETRPPFEESEHNEKKTWRSATQSVIKRALIIRPAPSSSQFQCKEPTTCSSFANIPLDNMDCNTEEIQDFLQSYAPFMHKICRIL